MYITCNQKCKMPQTDVTDGNFNKETMSVGVFGINAQSVCSVEILPAWQSDPYFNLFSTTSTESLWEYLFEVLSQNLCVLMM